jgi:hypothetical protein
MTEGTRFAKHFRCVVINVQICLNKTMVLCLFIFFRNNIFNTLFILININITNLLFYNYSSKCLPLKSVLVFLNICHYWERILTPFQTLCSLTVTKSVFRRTAYILNKYTRIKCVTANLLLESKAIRNSCYD